jgi:hypothetical protein
VNTARPQADRRGRCHLRAPHRPQGEGRVRRGHRERRARHAARRRHRRGDAFILQIADKTGATVFSNDSFQEFHGIYDWLFDEGRLVGGKPVPAVGWVFVLRTPVRGTSRRATRESRKGAAKLRRASLGPCRCRGRPPPRRGGQLRAEAGRGRGKAFRAPRRNAGRRARAAVAARTPSRVETVPSSPPRLRPVAVAVGAAAAAPRPADPINEPIPFIHFVTAHPVGSEVEATVDRFSSHGAYAVTDGGAQCYIPLKAMADPPPTKGREVLTVGEVRTFVVTAFDSSAEGSTSHFPVWWCPTRRPLSNRPSRRRVPRRGRNHQPRRHPAWQ